MEVVNRCVIEFTITNLFLALYFFVRTLEFFYLQFPKVLYLSIYLFIYLFVYYKIVH